MFCRNCMLVFDYVFMCVCIANCNREKKERKERKKENMIWKKATSVW